MGFWILGTSPIKRRRNPGHICTIMHNFMLIGATVIEMYVTANLVPCYTNVCRVMRSVATKNNTTVF